MKPNHSLVIRVSRSTPIRSYDRFEPHTQKLADGLLGNRDYLAAYLFTERELQLVGGLFTGTPVIRLTFPLPGLDVDDVNKPDPSPVFAEKEGTLARAPSSLLLYFGCRWKIGISHAVVSSFHNGFGQGRRATDTCCSSRSYFTGSNEKIKAQTKGATDLALRHTIGRPK